VGEVVDIQSAALAGKVALQKAKITPAVPANGLDWYNIPATTMLS
jgi:hypothetical protein